MVCTGFNLRCVHIFNSLFQGYSSLTSGPVVALNSQLLLEFILPFNFVILFRAEPLLARIKADRTVVVSPVFDKVHFDDLHVERYHASSHGFDWALWCMYEPFSLEWFKMKDESQPGRYLISKI